MSLAYYINPLIAVFMGALIFREKLSAVQWCAIALAAAGVAAQAAMDGRMPWLAVLIGLSFAVYGAIKKKANVPGEVSTFLETLLVSPVVIAVIVIMELRGGPVSTGQVAGWRLILLPLAGFVTYLPLALYSAGIRDTDMALSGILMYICPTLQMLCGLLLYNERMSTGALITFVCVWAAIGIYTLGGFMAKGRQEKRTPGGIT